MIRSDTSKVDDRQYHIFAESREQRGEKFLEKSTAAVSRKVRLDHVARVRISLNVHLFHK